MTAPTPDEYTPTTEEVRKATKPGSYRSWGPGTAYFDRWLAQHDAEVGEKVARAIEAWRPDPSRDGEPGHWKRGGRHMRLAAARIAREVTS